MDTHCIKFTHSKSLTVSLVISLFLLTACEPPAEDPFLREFFIRKGQHYSTPRLAEVLQSETLAFSAEFDQSAVYELGDNFLQTNKNKLFGFADCNSLHHENSARFAWQWFNDRLEIFAYCYVNSVRVEEFVGVVNLHEENLYEIRLENDAYDFYLNGKKAASVKRGNVCNAGAYYMLYPYFGGSVPAPHDIKIVLKRRG